MTRLLQAILADLAVSPDEARAAGKRAPVVFAVGVLLILVVLCSVSPGAGL